MLVRSSLQVEHKKQYIKYKFYKVYCILSIVLCSVVCVEDTNITTIEYLYCDSVQLVPIVFQNKGYVAPRLIKAYAPTYTLATCGHKYFYTVKHFIDFASSTFFVDCGVVWSCECIQATYSLNASPLYTQNVMKVSGSTSFLTHI